MRAAKLGDTVTEQKQPEGFQITKKEFPYLVWKLFFYTIFCKTISSYLPEQQPQRQPLRRP